MRVGRGFHGVLSGADHVCLSDCSGGSLALIGGIDCYLKRTRHIVRVQSCGGPACGVGYYGGDVSATYEGPASSRRRQQEDHRSPGDREIVLVANLDYWLDRGLLLNYVYAFLALKNLYPERCHLLGLSRLEILTCRCC